MDEQTFWFERTLQALEAGQSLEQALAAVPPALRAAVREAVEAALWMQNTATPALHRMAQTWTPPPPPPVPLAEPAAGPRLGARLTGWLARLGWAWVAAAVLVLLALTGGTAYAAARALPGEWAYSFKRAAEEWRWRRADDHQRLNLALDWSDRRLDEALQAQARARPDAVDQALRLYTDHLTRGQRIWTRLQAQGQATPALRHTVEARLKAQEPRLEALATESGWRAARAAHQAFVQAVAPEPGPRTDGPPPRAAPTRTPSATSAPGPTVTPTPRAATPTPTLPPGEAWDDARSTPPTPTEAPTDEACVSRGLGDAQNQCVPDDRGAGNDTNDNPAGSGSAPPGQGPPDAPPGQDNGPPDTPAEQDNGPPDTPPGQGNGPP